MILGTLLVVSATLTPSSSGSAGDSTPCLLICGSRGLADFLANVLLFLPVGASLGLLRMPLRWIGAVCAMMSLGIEVAQIGLIPGRDGNPADVVSNFLGGLAGGFVGLEFPRALQVSAPAALRRALFVAAAVLGVATATGLLLAASVPHGAYGASWTTGGPGYAAYPGRVQQMSIGGRRVAEGPSSFGSFEKQALRRGDPLRLVLQVAPPQPGLGHILSLEAGDEDVLFIGARSEDLILRYRSAAATLRLDQPALRLPQALSAREAGASLEIDVWRSGGRYCVRAGPEHKCPRFTAASGWVLLQHVGHFSDWARRRVDIAWLLLLCAPLGLWIRLRWESLAVLALAVTGLSALPPLVGLDGLSAVEWAAGAVGFLLGMALQWLARRALAVVDAAS